MKLHNLFEGDSERGVVVHMMPAVEPAVTDSEIDELYNYYNDCVIGMYFKVVTAYEEFRRESGSTEWPIEVCTARELADSVDHFITTYGGLDYDDLADDDFDD